MVVVIVVEVVYGGRVVYVRSGVISKFGGLGPGRVLTLLTSSRGLLYLIGSNLPDYYNFLL